MKTKIIILLMLASLSLKAEDKSLKRVESIQISYTELSEPEKLIIYDYKYLHSEQKKEIEYLERELQKSHNISLLFFVLTGILLLL